MRSVFPLLVASSFVAALQYVTLLCPRKRHDTWADCRFYLQISAEFLVQGLVELYLVEFLRQVTLMYKLPLESWAGEDDGSK